MAPGPSGLGVVPRGQHFLDALPLHPDAQEVVNNPATESYVPR
jgi:hypothetical protein